MAEVDREATCPFLLRLFWSQGRHNRPADYDLARRLLPRNELAIYSWRDATLPELSALVRGALRRRRQRGGGGGGGGGGGVEGGNAPADIERRARALHFMLVFPKLDGSIQRRALGVVTREGEAAAEAAAEAAEAVGGEGGGGGAGEGGGGGRGAWTLAQHGFQAGDFLDVVLR